MLKALQLPLIRARLEEVSGEAPGPREILFALVMGSGGRVHSRLGGLRKDQVSVQDGQR